MREARPPAKDGRRDEVHEVPSDNHIRALLDATPPERLGPVYGFLFEALARAGVLDGYRAPGGSLLLALDGTEYFSILAGDPLRTLFDPSARQRRAGR